MPELQFQFQYGPDDLKAIRTASGIVHHSPATTISVWICGLAVCLVTLGAIGYWSVLTVITVLGFSFLAFYVHRINRHSLTGVESEIHTLTLTDSKVTETVGHSHFEKSWDAFEEFLETDDHFQLRHYEKITLLPKRAIPDGELQACRTLIRERVGQNSSITLPRFDDWFQSGFGNPVYHFHWRDIDIEQLTRARLRPFNPLERDSSGLSGNQSIGTVLAALILTGFILLLFVVSTSASPPKRANWLNILVFPLAVCIPFAFAFAWWKYISRLAGKRLPRIPKDEIYVTHNDFGLLIGYPKAVAQYGWQDISAFYVGDRFIGFRPHNGLVHVIANQAFGGSPMAVDFLLIAEQHRQQFEQEPKPTTAEIHVVQETGNPYQPPAWMK